MLPRFSRLTLIPLLGLAALNLGGVVFAASAEKVDFNREVRPILTENCYHCHGPDEGSRKAKLRLDQREDALKERDGTRPIVPGDLSASELVLRITAEDPEDLMPPAKEHKKLTKGQIETLKKWVAQGADYAEHWSFVGLKPTPVPGAADPRWAVRNPIDAFITARLKLEGLAPSPEADRRALLRRLSLDLTGLAPTPEESNAFADDKAPDFYERAVDRLLASPTYGERWAKMWIDLARYADSTGYGQDSLRMNIWPWRDWIIKALNENKPYDQLSVEQIAGDLLPGATTEQISATAFHRNTMTNTEGGTDDEEFRIAAVKDRIATTGQVWMGLTVGCAQCHSHKFDPISHKEYYQLFAIFNQTEDADRSDEAPSLALPTEFENQQRERLNAEIATLETKLKETTPEFANELSQWENNIRVRGRWTVLSPSQLRATGGTELAQQADGSIVASGKNPPKSTYTLTTAGPLKGVTALRLELLTDSALPKGGPGRSANGNAVVTELRALSLSSGPTSGRFVRVELPGQQKMLALAEVEVFSAQRNIATQGKATQSSTGFDGPAQLAIDNNTEGHYFNGRSVTLTLKSDNPWWELDLGSEQPIDKIVLWNRTDTHVDHIVGGKFKVLDANRNVLFETEILEAPEPSVELDPRTGIAITLQNPSADFAQMGWEPQMALDGKEDTGWAIAPETGKEHALVAELKQPLDIAANGALSVVVAQNYPNHSLGRFRLSVTTQPAPVRELPARLQAILAADPAKREASDQEEVVTYFRTISQATAEIRKQIDAKKTALTKVKPVKLPIMKERLANQQRPNFIFNKGNFLTPGEKVTAALPGAFHPGPAGEINRLGMAQWIFAKENPLTARVAVNRYWAQIFGTGLVTTEEDFGTQGQLPSHPELLDWLAMEFMQPTNADAKPWDTKRLLKLLVTSATYRQSSKVSAEGLQKDPRNRLLARALGRRLDAEAIRDQALQLAGLLSLKMGGPSVYPPQPDGIWRVAFNNGQNAYPTSTGEDRWRRSIYTFWRRNAPNPTQTLFDAPSRETCSVRRIATNTPLQAFVTLNDPVFTECAQGLARRISSHGAASIEARLEFGFRLCQGHPATEEQIKTLKELYESEFAYYQGAPKEAVKLATSSELPLPASASAIELAAWTAVANVLLNLDGVLSIR